MTSLRGFSRKPTSSLISLSVEYIAKNLMLYKDSLQFLPPHVKERILRRLLVSVKIWSDIPKIEIFSILVHPNLKSINLSNITVDDDTLYVLKKCTSLTEINLRNGGNHSFSSKALIELFEKTTKLLVLDIANCKQFDDDALEHLSINCKNLHEMCAEGCNITDNGIAFLAQNNKKIKCLTVSETKVSGNGIINAVKNKNWKGLQELRVDNCPRITDDVLQVVIKNCPRIEILTFYNCAIQDENVFNDIANTCKNLKQLHWTISW